MRFAALFILLLSITALVHAQSDTVFNQTDNNNLKQGYWKKTYRDGKLMYKGLFKDNKPIGEMRRYYESGALKAILLYDQKSVYSRARLYYEDGSMAATGNYYNALKDSIWTYYSFYNKSITSRETWEKGLRQGTALNYYSNGDISEKTEWKNDKKYGSWEQYFSGNILKLKALYENGKLEGDFIVYTINSKPYLTGVYRNNQREGKWTFFNEDGSVQKVLNYQAGIAAEENKLNEEQLQFFRSIDEAQGKYGEPDETDFLQPQNR